MFISGNRSFCICWALHGRIWILWVIKLTLCPKFTVPTLHKEWALWFIRSPSWVFVFWVVIVACWCKFTITKSHVEGTIWFARPLGVVCLFFVFWLFWAVIFWSARPLRVIHVLPLLAQRSIWTICWTATIGIVWWPVWLLHEADRIRKLTKKAQTSQNLGKYSAVS